MNDVYRQLHSVAAQNAAHVLKAFVSWFAFFWTLNMSVLTLGKFRTEEVTLEHTRILCALFIVLNVLALVLCICVYYILRKLEREADGLIKRWGGDAVGSLPTCFIPCGIVCLCAGITFVITVAVWGYWLSLAMVKC